MHTTCIYRAVTLVCAMAGLIGLGAPRASADGMPGARAPVSLSPTQWGGFYIGANVGAAWSEGDWQYDNANYFNTLGPTVLGTEFDHGARGVVGGGQAGYNYQSGPWVIGIEGSAVATDLDESHASPFFPTIDTYQSKINWLATVTGRVGYAWDQWLAYAKGGWAGGDVELGLHDHVELIDATTSTWANGWTIGAGAEYMLCKGISLGLEYDYIALNLDGETVGCPLCGTGVGLGTPVVDSNIAINTVMARLNYHFGQ